MTPMPPSLLLPLPAESMRAENTLHRLVEGDNLDVLQHLLQTHGEVVKLVYIDPPYNTGKAFTYGDRRGEGWEEMMRPRLEAAHALLRPDGAIVVHIDEHELARLTLMLDEIFGREQRLGTIVWDKKNPKGDAKGIAVQHESIVCYAKTRVQFHPLERAKPNVEQMLDKASALMDTIGTVRLPPDLAETATRYRLPEPALAPHRRAQTLEDVNKAFGYWLKKQASFRPGERAYNRIDEHGRVFQAVSMAWPNKKKAPDAYFIPLEHPVTDKPCPVPQRGWRNPPQTMARLLSEDRIIFGSDETTQPRRKYFLDETRTESVPSIIRDAGCDDKRLGGYGVPFDHAKPLSLAQKIVRWFTRDPGDLVLDFFAGSGTTGHAVLAENAERHTGLTFWLVQRAEPVGPKSAAARAGFEHVAQMTRARIKAAIDELDDEFPLPPREDRGFLAQRYTHPS